MPAGDRYVEVPAERMIEFLKSKGFVLARNRSRREVVYERSHDKDPGYRVVVYTSISAGNAKARKLGADAIRVCAIYEDVGRSFGVAKLPRVFRTGSVDAVLARTLERMRDAYARCTQRINETKRRMQR